MDAGLSGPSPGEITSGTESCERSGAAVVPGNGHGIRSIRPRPAWRPPGRPGACRGYDPTGDGAGISLLGGAGNDATRLGAGRAEAGRGRVGADTAGHGCLAGQWPGTGTTVLASPTG